MSELVAAGPGFFGKVRTHGDFVTRRLPPAFVTPWDESLQRGMLFGQQWFGAQWLPVYLNAPVWCFALGAGVCGESAWAGVLMPGVDRVGRYFPFTLAAPLARDAAAGWLGGAQVWYDEAVRRALSTLSADFVLERFDAELAAWGPLQGVSAATGAAAAWRLCPVESAVPAVSTASMQSAGSAGPTESAAPATPVAPAESAASAAPAEAAAPAAQREASNEAQAGALAHDSFAALLSLYAGAGSGAWWTEGSSAVPATLLGGPGLPDGERFVGLLDAARNGWPSVVKLRI
jgi:type VI secretion system protein ImpM